MADESQATPEGGSTPAPGGQEAPAPAPAPPVSGAGEQKAYERAPTPPEGFPEKFLKDGQPDYNALLESYTQLESQRRSFREEAEKELREEREKAAPEAYEPPKIDAWDAEEMKSDPTYQWWENQAKEMGLSQEQFEGAIKQYAEANASKYDQEKEMEALGDNAQARINAVGNWMARFKDNPGVYAQLDSLAYTAQGIEALEYLMGQQGVSAPDGKAAPSGKITVEELRAMQADPRYWNSSLRDEAFVKKVNEGYEQLYGDKG